MLHVSPEKLKLYVVIKPSHAHLACKVDELRRKAFK